MKPLGIAHAYIHTVHMHVSFCGVLFLVYIYTCRVSMSIRGILAQVPEVGSTAMDLEDVRRDK